MYDAIYRNRLGANWWAVYNAMTDWSTHFGAVRQSSERNIASIQNDRQQVIRKAIKSEPVLRLASWQSNGLLMQNLKKLMKKL